MGKSFAPGFFHRYLIPSKDFLSAGEAHRGRLQQLLNCFELPAVRGIRLDQQMEMEICWASTALISPSTSRVRRLPERRREALLSQPGLSGCRWPQKDAEGFLLPLVLLQLQLPSAALLLVLPQGQPK